MKSKKSKKSKKSDTLPLNFANLMTVMLGAAAIATIVSAFTRKPRRFRRPGTLARWQRGHWRQTWRRRPWRGRYRAVSRRHEGYHPSILESLIAASADGFRGALAAATEKGRELPPGPVPFCRVAPQKP